MEDDARPGLVAAAKAHWRCFLPAWIFPVFFLYGGRARSCITYLLDRTCSLRSAEVAEVRAEHDVADHMIAYRPWSVSGVGAGRPRVIRSVRGTTARSSGW